MNLEFIKTHKDAVLPVKNHSCPAGGDAGADLTSVEAVIVPARGSVVVPVGLKLGYVSPGFWFKFESRSGLAFKHSIMCNPGICDNGYRGDLGVKLYNLSDVDVPLAKGSRVAQIIVYQMLYTEIDWADEASDSERGEDGFGSSGI